MQGPIRSITPSGQLNPRGLKRNAEYMGSLFALDAPDGHAFHQGATGTSLVDQRPKRHLAIIQDAYGSGSGQSGSGAEQNRTGRQIAADMLSAYDAIFAMWTIENDTYTAREIANQPSVLALEANGVTDVPAGAVVELLPGPGQPDFYYFWWTGEVVSGSGANSLTINCSDGSTYTATISGTTITVE